MKTSSLALYTSKETYIYEKKYIKEKPLKYSIEPLVCHPEDEDFFPSPVYDKRDLYLREKKNTKETS